MVIDAHTHLMPERLGLAIRRFFEQGISSGLVYPIDNQTVLERLATEGVTQVWNLPYAHRSGIAPKLNADLLSLADGLSNQRIQIVSGCTVHPDDAEPVRDLAHAVQAGARVLKLHCSVGEYQPNDSRLTPVLAEAGVLGIPIVIHAGKAVSGSTDEQDLKPIGDIASKHKETTFVLAHFGHHASGAAIGLLRRHQNLLADLTPVVMEPVPLSAELAEEFSDRLLFGSDAPNTGCSVTSLVDGLQSLKLDPATYAKITHGNAERLVPS